MFLSPLKNKFFIGLLTTTSAVFLACLLHPAFAVPASPEGPALQKGAITYKGYLIQQNVLNLGAVTIYLTPRHWMIKAAMFTIIVDEDHDSLVAYTKQTNKYIKDTLKIGMRRFGNFRNAGDFDWGSSKVAGSDQYLGHKTVIIERRGKRNDMKVVSDVIISEKQASCPDIEISKVFQNVGTSLLSQDYSRGLVVRVTRMAHSANPRYCTIRPVLAMDTLVLQEKTFPACDFNVPAGLTKVASEIDLFSGGELDTSSMESNQVMLRRRGSKIMLPAGK